MELLLFSQNFERDIIFDTVDSQEFEIQGTTRKIRIIETSYIEIGNHHIKTFNEIFIVFSIINGEY